MKICIFGAGGFAKEVFFLLNDLGISTEAFIDLHEGTLLGVPIKTRNFFFSSTAMILTVNMNLQRGLIIGLLMAIVEILQEILRNRNHSEKSV